MIVFLCNQVEFNQRYWIKQAKWYARSERNHIEKKKSCPLSTCIHEISINTMLTSLTCAIHQISLLLHAPYWILVHFEISFADGWLLSGKHSTAICHRNRWWKNLLEEQTTYNHSQAAYKKPLHMTIRRGIIDFTSTCKASLYKQDLVRWSEQLLAGLVH